MHFKLVKNQVKLLVTTLIFVTLFAGISSTLATTWTSYTPYYDEAGWSVGGHLGAAQASANTNGWLKCYASANAYWDTRTAFATATVSEEFTAPAHAANLIIRVDVKFNYYAKCVGIWPAYASVKVFVTYEQSINYVWVKLWENYMYIDTVTNGGSSSKVNYIKILQATTYRTMTEGLNYRITVTYITDVQSVVTGASYVQYTSSSTLKSTCYVYSINIGY